jgi:hypothetical protein
MTQGGIMTSIQPQIFIGNAPDYALRLVSNELFHHVSIEVTREHRKIHNNSYSHKSLTQALRELKQKLAPWGWTPKTKIEWKTQNPPSGEFINKQGTIAVTYHFHSQLTNNQKILLTTHLIGEFTPFLPISKAPT